MDQNEGCWVAPPINGGENSILLIKKSNLIKTLIFLLSNHMKDHYFGEEEVACKHGS
jgi:hypothetical protein